VGSLIHQLLGTKLTLPQGLMLYIMKYPD